MAKEEQGVTIQEQDHERARRADAFWRDHVAEISQELSPSGRPLRSERNASLSDSWECFAATGKIGDYLEFVRRREKEQ